ELRVELACGVAQPPGRDVVTRGGCVLRHEDVIALRPDHSAPEIHVLAEIPGHRHVARAIHGYPVARIRGRVAAKTLRPAVAPVDPRKRCPCPNRCFRNAATTATPPPSCTSPETRPGNPPNSTRRRQSRLPPSRR